MTGRGRPLVLYNDQCDISLKLDIVTRSGMETGNKSLTVVDKISGATQKFGEFDHKEVPYRNP